MNKLIRELREQAHLSQTKLAALMGVNQSTISRLEHDCSNTNYKLIFKILLFLQQKTKQTNDHMPSWKQWYTRHGMEFLTHVMDHEIMRHFIMQNPQQAANDVCSWVTKQKRVM